MLESLLQDLRYAARRLLRAPGFTITAALTLAIGIGAVTSVFSLVDGVLLSSLPFPAADRLMWVEDNGTAPLGLYDIARSDRGSIEAAAAYSNQEPAALRRSGAAAGHGHSDQSPGASLCDRRQPCQRPGCRPGSRDSRGTSGSGRRDQGLQA